MKNNKLKHSASILGVSTVAAAWLIAGPDILLNLGASARVTELLTLPVAMIAFIWIVSKDKKAMACDRRILKRLFGK